MDLNELIYGTSRKRPRQQESAESQQNNDNDTQQPPSRKRAKKGANPKKKSQRNGDDDADQDGDGTQVDKVVSSSTAAAQTAPEEQPTASSSPTIKTRESILETSVARIETFYQPPKHVASGSTSDTDKVVDPSFLYPTVPPKPKPPPKLAFKDNLGSLPKSRKVILANPEKYLATPSEVQVRQTKKKRSLEWCRIRLKWLARKLDLRNEPDVGNAIANLVEEENLFEKIALEESKEQSTNEEPAVSPDQATRNSAARTEDEDTSDEEQNNILSQLERSSQKHRQSLQLEQQEGDDNLTGNEDLRPYSELLDYYQLGHAAPRIRHDLNGVNITVVARSFIPKIAGRRKRKLPNRPREPSLYTKKVEEFYPNNRKSMPKSLLYFPLHNRTSKWTYENHQRFLFALAARHFLGTAGFSERKMNYATGRNDDGDDLGSASTKNTLEDRLLRLLWTPEISNYSQLRLLLRQRSEQARDLECFVRHQWKDAGNAAWKAAAHLGLTSELQQTGPPGSIGHFLWETAVLQERRRNRDRFCVKEFAAGKLNYSFESDRSKLVRNEKKNLPPLTASTNFLPVPGAVPPIPSFPLGPHNILFGPRDKYHFVNQRSVVSEEIFKLSLSSLLSRLTTVEIEERELAKKRTERCIRAMAEALIKIHENRLYKRAEQNGLRIIIQDLQELPANFFAKSVESYLSIWANGGALLKPIPRPSFSTSDEKVTSQPESIKSDFQMQVTDSYSEDDEMTDNNDSIRDPQSLTDLFNEWKEHKSLHLFSNLHVTFGLFEISRVLPRSAIDLLARPLDRSRCRTPFDVIRQLLEFMEEHEMIVGDNVTVEMNNNAVNVGELEHAFHLAAASFVKSVERDVVEVDFHSWHLATLAGSFLLCSGIRIGSSARVYPSFYDGRNLVFDEFSAMRRSAGAAPLPQQQQEIRLMLPKFQEMRVAVARAFKVLVLMAAHQGGARSHLAIVSFLEWRQVIALLVGPSLSPGGPAEKFRQIRSLHDRHAVQWAVKESSSASIKFLQKFARGQDEKISISACALETDPCSFQHWLNLAMSLGLLGTAHRCDKAACKDCIRLADGLFMKHDLQKLRSEGNRAWWGMGRVSWWDTMLLAVPTMAADDVPYSDRKSICHIIQLHLRGVFLDLSFRANDVTEGNDVDANKSREWLDEIIMAECTSSQQNAGEDGKQPSLKVRNKSVDANLPPTFRQVMNDDYDEPQTTFPDRTCTLAQELLEVDLNENEELMVLCYKLLIRAHLYGLQDPSFEQGIIWLAWTAWKQSVDDEAGLQSNEMSALAYLYRMGLNIVALLHQAFALSMPS